ncbi:hypothetical protein ACJIZ3_011720 [Penstemon smallii]|uniref:Uncharacterized protein n=1 Tax=Penstemon smallii TaxID=265156 RepID=A0ABD3UN61_9LAMI
MANQEQLILQENDCEFDPVRLLAKLSATATAAAAHSPVRAFKKRSSPSNSSSPSKIHKKLFPPSADNPPLRRTISSPLPPLPPSPLRRTSSAPVPSQVVPAQRTLSSCSPNSNAKESPGSKRLKRMNEKVQELSELVMSTALEEDDCNNDNNKDDDEYDENESEEAVCIEKKEDGGLSIHFKCPCGKIYEVLVSADNKKIYYKLM